MIRLINIDQLRADLEEFARTHARKSKARILRESFDRYEQMTPSEIIEELKQSKIDISKSYLKTAMSRIRKERT